MVKAIRIHEHGGPDVLKYEDVEVGKPGKGQVRLKQHAVGLNFIDIYTRSGAYPAAEMPFIPGSEGAGEVVAVGAGVKNLKVGDRVAYSTAPGAYAEERLAPADRLVKLPRQISYELGASIMLKGLTAQYLLRRTYKVKKGDTILFHAAAGGVGQIAVQWARALGATVIGTVGSDDKAKMAKKLGCHHVINYKKEDFVERVRKITKGAGVDAVYDGVGKDTFPGSLDCLKPLGIWVYFGAASGPVPEMDPSMLMRKGSLFATRPSLMHYAHKQEDLARMARDLFKVIADGKVKVQINQRYPLKNAARAHQDLASRKTTGATVLIP